MKTIELNNPKKIEKNIQPQITEPNVTEDCIFIDWTGKEIWFYLKNPPEKIKKIAHLMNKELMSDRVPKKVMNRVWFENWERKMLDQYSCIIWAVKPEIFKRRYVPSYSHVHLCKSAEKYIQLVYLFAEECEKLIKELTPELYEEQKKLLESQEIKIWSLFTSSIANCNFAARTHIDWWNIQWANNIIYYKRENSIWWNLHVPWYDAVIDSCDDSLLFYPAWRDIHWVEEIIPTKSGWYRNSIVLYPLNIKYRQQEETEEKIEETKTN